MGMDTHVGRDPEGHPIRLGRRALPDAAGLARPASAPDAHVSARTARLATSLHRQPSSRRASSNSRSRASAHRARCSGPPGLGDGIPCTDDNSTNERGEATYTTPPMRRTLELSGPSMARLWVTTTARDAVARGASHGRRPRRQGDRADRRLARGQLPRRDPLAQPIRRRRNAAAMAPVHAQSVLPVEPGEPDALSVEVFPTRATIERGHRLRISIGPSDFPHQLPPAAAGANSLAGNVQMLTEPDHASYVTLPKSAAAARAVPAAADAEPDPRRLNLRVRSVPVRPEVARPRDRPASASRGADRSASRAPRR